MIKTELEKYAGKPLKNDEFNFVMKMATDDIRVNRIHSSKPKKTKLVDAMMIVISSYIVYQRCL
jgi:hypothetical protein